MAGRDAEMARRGSSLRGAGEVRPEAGEGAVAASRWPTYVCSSTARAPKMFHVKQKVPMFRDRGPLRPFGAPPPLCRGGSFVAGPDCSMGWLAGQDAEMARRDSSLREAEEVRPEVGEGALAAAPCPPGASIATAKCFT